MSKNIMTVVLMLQIFPRRRAGRGFFRKCGAQPPGGRVRRGQSGVWLRNQVDWRLA